MLSAREAISCFNFYSSSLSHNYNKLQQNFTVHSVNTAELRCFDAGSRAAKNCQMPVVRAIKILLQRCDRDSSTEMLRNSPAGILSDRGIGIGMTWRGVYGACH